MYPNTVFISNLNLNTTESDLVDYFNKYVSDSIDISKIKIVRCPDTNKSRGFSYVTLNSKSDFDIAMTLDETVFQERALRLSEAAIRRPIQKIVRKTASK